MEGALSGRRRFRYYRTAHALLLEVEYNHWLEAYKHWACFWRLATPEDITDAETIVGLDTE